ncbi:MAG: restriction endonuclease subunit S, partial [Candidatus Heimdallarchaeota archaeon]|nr:restriction endonuclease subunit S [Candidatus Heimdallarchaeota archaeon]MCK4611239.1 restriction endonuclease subunit S [Candidatus Heimdallarchaeota archaeon]
LFSQLPENWTKCSIDQISFMIGSGSTPKGGKKNYQESGIRFIRSQNVLDQKLNFTEIAYINETIHKNMYRTHVYFGDVLLNITGASIGRVASYTDDKPANVNQHVCIIRLVRLIPEWITLFLASEFGQDQIMSKQSGMTREGLNYEQLRQITLPLPPIEEQKEILKIYNRCLSTIECVEKVVIKEIENTELLKQSILKSAFEGNLISTNNGEEDENLSKHLDVKKSYDHQTKLDNWT